MLHYYVNQNEQDNGDHEVHDENCSWLPDVGNREYLGLFNNCRDAVTKAQLLHPYWRINGCYFCCNPCHTS
ncbi:MAG: hypothetical protein LBU20_01930 [Candidatus Nomurabacteria bacterium]|nr:hypothetical protein [Candidatus Nomurabacteria bacterium]